MAVLRLSFLGTFAVQRDDVPITTFRGDKVRALLAYLAMESVRSHARGSLAGLFWPEQPQDAALNNLSQALGRLRAALGSVEPPMLLLTRQAVGWNTASTAAVDVTTFVRLAQSTAIADLEAAAALYGGPFLPGFALPGCEEFEEWLALTREHLDRLAVGALDALARAYLEARSYAAAEAAARRQLALDPWRESAHRQVMAALAGAGQRAAALAHYAACRRALQDGLGVAPDAATTALYERLRAETAAPEDAAAPAADTLPVALTPLVGREADLAALGALLRAEGVRLLTLVGAGGMGKTRLALELARAQRAAFGDGVFLVSLAPLADAAAILPALAATLRVTTPAGDLRQTVLHALRGKHLLLVLDNFEHLLDGAELVVDLLQAAPRVRIIATSREPLAVRGEHVYGVQGLAYAAGAAPAAATAAPAVRLFVQAARRARADFTPRPADLAAILRICALVRGMPLGLEMAAAWIGLLAPEEIAQEIARGADILAADWPDAPERQRSMRAVFAWSWALLDDAGRGALRRLSVFRGGFTRAAAEQVAGAPLGALAALVRASLVARRPGEAGRYEIHELLRQFAAEELDAVPGEHAAVEARHGAYYLALAEAAEAEYAGPRQVAWLDRLEPDHDNIRAAQEWAARRGEVTLELRLAGAVAYFWFLRGYHAEGRARLRHALARPEAQAPSAARARALNAAGYFAWVDGDLGEAHAALAEAARIARATGDRPTLAFGLCYLGAVANDRRDYQAAEALLAESLAIWRALGGDNRGLSLMFLGDAALGRRERARARAAFAESADLLREAGNVSLLPYPVRRLGYLAQEDGDLALAAACYAESLRLNREVGDRRGLAAALVGFAAMARDRGQWCRLARLLGAIEGLLRAAETRLLPFDQEHFDRCVAALRAHPEAATLDRAWAEGQALSPERAMAYAQEGEQEQEPAGGAHAPVLAD